MRSRITDAAVIAAAVALAGAFAAAPASAGSVYNSHDSNMTAQVVWGTGDPETGAGHYGGIYGDIESWATIVGLWEDDSVAFDCDAGTPDDPADDYLAFAGTMRSGDAEGTVTIAPNLGSAVVTGELTITTVAYDMCTGTYEELAMETGVPVRLDLVATLQRTNESDATHELVAGVYNSHQIMHSADRWAAGTATLGGVPYPYDSGLISRNTWSYHENSH